MSSPKLNTSSLVVINGITSRSLPIQCKQPYSMAGTRDTAMYLSTDSVIILLKAKNSVINNP